MAKTTKKAAPKKAASGDILEKANIVHALAYIPYFIGPVAMYFLGKSDKKATMHHIKYSAMLAFVGIALAVLLLGSLLGKFIGPVYIIGSIFLGWKAYNGEEVHVEILDTIEGKISEQVKK